MVSDSKLTTQKTEKTKELHNVDKEHQIFTDNLQPAMFKEDKEPWQSKQVEDAQQLSDEFDTLNLEIQQAKEECDTPNIVHAVDRYR